MCMEAYFIVVIILILLFSNNFNIKLINIFNIYHTHTLFYQSYQISF